MLAMVTLYDYKLKVWHEVILDLMGCYICDMKHITPAEGHTYPLDAMSMIFDHRGDAHPTNESVKDIWARLRPH